MDSARTLNRGPCNEIMKHRDNSAIQLKCGSEKEDFLSVISENGYQVQDFEAYETTDRPTADGLVHDVIASVSVTYKPTGWMKKYNSSSGTSWVVAFKTDLKKGIVAAGPRSK